MPLHRRKAKGNWHAEFTDAAGNRIRRSTGTADKQLAQRILDQWKLEAAANRHHIKTTKHNCDQLITEYAAYLAGNSDTHRQKTEARIRRVVDAADFRRPEDITQYLVETTVRSLTNARNGQPMAAHTQSHYLTAMKMFTAWLVDIRHALPRDPLANVKKPSWQADRRVTRRFLLPAEWNWLKLTPNALLYEVAIQTGYRARELGQLTAASLRDDHLFLAAKYTKNKQPAKQFITEALRQKLVGKLPLSIPTPDRLAEVLRADLAIARWFAANDNHTLADGFLQPIDPRGDVLDFHALRHTCGAWLAISGVGPKVIQSVMRHSTISLTLDTYGHLMPGAEKDAVAHFDKLLGQ